MLVQKTWSQLRSLEVHSTLMLPDSMQTLAKFQVGLLERLVLAACRLTSRAIAVLVRAEWPLRELSCLAILIGTETAVQQRIGN